MSRKLTGTVTCNKPDRKINPEATVDIKILDVSLADAGAVTIAETQLTGITDFPFDFEIEVEVNKIHKANPAIVFAQIRTNDKLDYWSDTSFRVIVPPSLKMEADHINMFVVPSSSSK